MDNSSIEQSLIRIADALEWNNIILMTHNHSERQEQKKTYLEELSKKNGR